MLKLVSMFFAIVLVAGNSLFAQEVTVLKQGDLIEPCSIISATLMKSLIKNDKIFVITKKFASSTSCIYDWEKPNVVEINKINDSIQAAADKNGQKAHLLNKYYNVTITFEKKFNTPEEAESAFKNMIHNLEKGVTSDTKGLKQLISANFDKKAENIGDINAWSSQLFQLSVKSGQYFYHVKVTAFDDMEENFELSKKIAEEIEKKLKTL